MGDIVRTLKLFDLVQTRDGMVARKKPAAVVRGLLDTGASISIIPTKINDALGTMPDPTGDIRRLEGKDYPVRWMVVQTLSPACRPRMVRIIVSDELAARTRLKGVEVILGHEYMQVERMSLHMADRQDGLQVWCEPESADDAEIAVLRAAGSEKKKRAG